MWRLLLALVLRAADAFPTTHHSASTCSRDALYTSLSSSGIEFCSSIVKYGHCNGEYSTPAQYATYNQTRIYSSCRCIWTNLTTITPTSNIAAATIRDPTTTLTFRSGSWNDTLVSSKSCLETPARTENATSTSCAGNNTSPSVATVPNKTRAGDPASYMLPIPANVTITTSYTWPSITTPPATRFTILPFPSISSWNITKIPPAGSQSSNRTSPSTLKDISLFSQTPMSRSSIFIGLNSSASSEDPGTATPSIPVFTITSSPSASDILISMPSWTVPTIRLTNTRRPNSTSLESGKRTSSTPDLTESPQSTTTTSALNSTSSQVGSSASNNSHEFPATNFTRVTRTAAVSQRTCYHLPRGSEKKALQRAMLHNSKLREENVTIPVPYIESIQFDNSGLAPLFLTLRDDEGGIHYLDISNRSRIAIIDKDCNTMVMDRGGIYFSSDSCTYTVTIRIHDMLRQLAGLAGAQCAAVKQKKRMADLEFQQVINLHDQCGYPVDRSLREYPQLRVGDSACTDAAVDEAVGRWEFDCTFPGSASGSMRCQAAIKNDVEDLLLMDPFGGSCPDISTVVTTLAATGQDFLATDSFREALNGGGGGRGHLNQSESESAEAAAKAYEQLWGALRKILSKDASSPGMLSALEHYMQVYNAHRSLKSDVCEALHAGDLPLNLSLAAGASAIDAITALNWAPESPPVYNITIQNPSAKACCASGYQAQGHGEVCAYPSEAVVVGTGCICGTMAAGGAVAFEYAQCDNFAARCDGDQDCEDAGLDRFVCLMGTCCGGGVCVDPYACSQNGTDLVKFGGSTG